MITRREFFKRTAFISAGIYWVMAGNSCSNITGKGHKQLVASSVDCDINKLFPSSKRVPLGWKAFPVSYPDGKNLAILYFQGIETEKAKAPVMLRITAAIDFRDEKQVRVYLPGSGITIGIFVIRYAHPFQPFEIPIDSEYLKEIAKEGIGLELTEGTDDAWFFVPDPSMDDNLGLQPHLLSGECNDTEESFYRNLYSMNSFSPFGWMGGCVLDALYELHLAGDIAASNTLELHLEHYMDAEKGIIFENPHTMPMDGGFNSLEDFLPFACIALLHPDHISVEQALQYLLRLKNEQGLIMNGRHVTTEGAYTVAYSLAAIAEVRVEPELAQIALNQIIYRIDLLIDDEAIYQRATLDGAKGFQNWGRGLVWQLLGTIKTLRIIERNDFGELKGIDTIKHSFLQGVKLALRHRNEQGMWHAYIDHHEYRVDTSTTAGIAAAIAWGVKQGLLDVDYLSIAEKAYQGLLNYVSPDGFLRNVSQINRGGEELQRSPYRVISQFGMGLMAQLKAVLMQHQI